MKKTLVLTCTLFALLGGGCCRSVERPRPVYGVWTGTGEEELAGAAVYAELGQRGGRPWKPLKYIAGGEKLDLMLRELEQPEVYKPHVDGGYALVIFFFDGYPDAQCFGCGLKVREVPCDVEGDIFIGPRGESKALGRLLNEATECKPYWQYELPDPNAVKDMQEELYEAARERSVQLRNDPNWRKGVEEHFQQPEVREYVRKK